MFYINTSIFIYNIIYSPNLSCSEVGIKIKCLSIKIMFEIFLPPKNKLYYCILTSFIQFKELRRRTYIDLIYNAYSYTIHNTNYFFFLFNGRFIYQNIHIV